MEPLRDMFFVSADPDINKRLKIKASSGEHLFIDTDFNPFAYATRVGIITHIPKVISEEWANDNPLKIGDTVMFHHMAIQDLNKIVYDGEDLFKVDYNQIFAKVVNENVIPLETVMYVSPIIENEESLFLGAFKIKENVGEVNNVGIIQYLSKSAELKGLKKADIIYYTEYANYKTDVLGNEFYRVRIRNIRLVERDGEILCFDNTVILENGDTVFKLDSNITDLKIGDKVHFFDGVFPKVDYKGKALLSVKRENINMIIMSDGFEILPSERQNRVLIEQAEAEDMDGGVFIPESVSKKPMKGKVVAVSDFYIHGTLGQVISLLEPGDTILYEKGSGKGVIINGNKYVLLLEGNIYARI